MAPATATLEAWPRTRTVARKLEAIPNRGGGTAPMTALLFGGWNRACPKPVTAKGQTMSQKEARAVSWLRNQGPRNGGHQELRT
jgi:hypothetical protein